MVGPAKRALLEQLFSIFRIYDSITVEVKLPFPFKRSKNGPRIKLDLPPMPTISVIQVAPTIVLQRTLA
jgi:hypothetical protein